MYIDPTSTSNNNTIRSNIVSEADYKRIASQTLEIISDTLSKSLGYYGSNSILEDKLYGHTITKDGYTILNKIKFDNAVSTTILEIIKNVSRDLVREVGDGSTSSIVIADKLFKLINECPELKNYPMKLILETLDKIQDHLIKEVEKVAIPITEENFDIVRKIATISNNNDEKIGQMIYDIYKQIGKDGFVHIEKSHTEEDRYEFIDGIELGRGYVASEFANQANKKDCVLNEPYILLCNDTLDSTDLNLLVDVLGNLMARQGKPIVIIAKGYSVEFVSCWQINIRENKRQGKDLPICLIDYSFANNSGYETFDDLATFIGASIYEKRTGDTPDNFLPMLGSCDKIVVTENNTKILGCHGNKEKINERISYIEEFIEQLKSSSQIRDISDDLYKAQNRIANLKGKIVRFFVGGETDIEKENKKYLIEDSIFAVRSALKHGYVAGGNLTIPRIINKQNLMVTKENREEIDIETILYQLICKAFIHCYSLVLENSSLFNKTNDTKLSFLDNDDVDRDKIQSTIVECIANDIIFNLKTNDYENISETNIINSSMTESMILKSSLSIVGLLATSNQFIKNSVTEIR